MTRHGRRPLYRSRYGNAWQELRCSTCYRSYASARTFRYVPWPAIWAWCRLPCRYFASRDELLTALILDAYNSLGVATEQAEGAVARSDLLGRWLATCRGVRDWARANPHEYAKIYGSPVPGYAAPQDTVAPASRAPLLLVAILRDGHERGRVRAERGERIPRVVRTELAQLGRQPGLDGLPEAVLARGVTAWVHLFGLISFELFGRLDGVIDDLDAYFDYEMGALARRAGIS